MDDIWESIDCVEDITDRPAPFSFIFLVNVGKGERENYKKIKDKDDRDHFKSSWKWSNK